MQVSWQGPRAQSERCFSSFMSVGMVRMYMKWKRTPTTTMTPRWIRPCRLMFHSSRSFLVRSDLLACRGQHTHCKASECSLVCSAGAVLVHLYSTTSQKETFFLLHYNYLTALFTCSLNWNFKKTIDCWRKWSIVATVSSQPKTTVKSCFYINAWVKII